jgi:hypothetical protein
MMDAGKNESLRMRMENIAMQWRARGDALMFSAACCGLMQNVSRWNANQCVDHHVMNFTKSALWHSSYRIFAATSKTDLIVGSSYNLATDNIPSRHHGEVRHYKVVIS